MAPSPFRELAYIELRRRGGPINTERLDRVIDIFKREAVQHKETYHNAAFLRHALSARLGWSYNEVNQTKFKDAIRAAYMAKELE